MKLSIYFRSALILVVSFACAEREWYKKELSTEQEQQYAKQLRGGASWRSYQGTVPEQLQHYEALALDSTNGDLWRELGTARVKRGILDEMEFYYEEAVKRKPGKWAGFRGYLYLYFYRDFERAIADFNYNDEVLGEVSYSQGQHHDYMRGIAYYGLADYQAALSSLQKYIDQITAGEGEDWVDVNAFLYKGLALAQLDQYEEAIDAFDAALKYYPKLADAYYHKAKIYATWRADQEALEALRAAESYFHEGYFHQRPYVEVLEQIYLQDILTLKNELMAKKAFAS